MHEHTSSVSKHGMLVDEVALMSRAVSGTVPEEPVVNRNNGQLFEKRLVEKAVKVISLAPPIYPMTWQAQPIHESTIGTDTPSTSCLTTRSRSSSYCCRKLERTRSPRNLWRLMTWSQ